MKTKSLLTLLFCILSSAALLAACSQETAPPPPSSGAAAPAGDASPAADTNAPSDAMVEISISMFDRGHPADAGTANENDVTAFINSEMNKLGINMTWMSAPRAEARTIFNTWVAAGTAPDMIWEYSRPWMDQLRIQGVIRPIDDYIQTMSVQYRDYFNANSGTLAPFITLDDGYIYATATLRNVEALPVASIWYRRDMLERAGWTGPLDTLDDIIAAARAVQAYDSNLVPISASPMHYRNLMVGLHGLGGNEIIGDDGNLVPYWSTPNFYDAVSVMRLLFQEGLKDSEYLVDTTGARERMLFVSGQTAFQFQTWSPPTGWEELLEMEPDADIQPIGTVATDYGRFMLTPQAPPFIYTMFTTAMSLEQVQAGFTFLDWLLSPISEPGDHPSAFKENWQHVQAGFEGTHWQFNQDGLRENIEGAPAWFNGGEYAVVQNPPLLRKGEIAARGATPLMRDMFARQEAGLYRLMNNPISNILPFDYSGEDYVLMMQSWSPIGMDIEVQMITNPNFSVDEGIAQMEAQWAALNGPTNWADKNAWFKANEDMILNFRQSWSDWMISLVAELAP